MAEFATSAALSIEIPDAELRAARADIEAELDDVPVGVSASGGGAAGPPAADGGLGTLTTLQEDQLDVLEDILDELEGGAIGGGGGGLDIPFLGGGGGGGGGPSFIEGLFAGDLIRRLFGGGGGGGGAGGGRFGGPGAAGTALLSNQLFSLLTGRDAPAGGAFQEGESPVSRGPLETFIADQFQNFGQNTDFSSLFNFGVGGGPPGAGGPGPDVGAGIGEPSPQFQALIEQFDSAVSETPAWLSRLERTAQRLTSEAAPTPSDPGPRGRDAGAPSGSERGLSAAERAIFSGGRQPTGSGGTTVGGVPTGFQSADGGDPRDRAREARDRGQTSAEVTVNADVNLDNLEAELRRFRDDVLNEVDRRLRDLNGGPGR